uniref:Fibrinogen C-terminal domain-containing protein n=1 Tax=Glossina brevipalpis TaxID=37001 RepID=A0A1A9W738_9MUSC
MNYGTYFLSLIWLWRVCTALNSSDEEVPMCGYILNQLDVMKANNEIFKLRFEMLENRLQQFQKLFESNFQTVTSMNENTYRLLQLQHTETLPPLKNFDEILMKQYEKVSEIHISIQNLEDKISKNDEMLSKTLTTELTILKSWSDELNKTEHRILHKVRSLLNDTQQTILQGVTGQSKSLQNITDVLIKRIDQQLTEESRRLERIQENQISLNMLNDGLKRMATSHTVYVHFDEQRLTCWADSSGHAIPTNCAEYNSKYCWNSICRIKPLKYDRESFLVACNEKTDGGGWTIIQRRINGSVDFYRDWAEYKKGFGHIEGEYWIGLDRLHALTNNQGTYELQIILRDFDNVTKYAKYDQFIVSSESEKYSLKDTGKYSGNAGNSFGSHKSYPFSTKDQDNDKAANYSCAQGKHGAWWYESCQWSNLNGFYYPNGTVINGRTGTGINWGEFHGFNYSMKFVQMMIRPRTL